jgi:uncharacterized protein YbjT (DUF2867 family)
MSGQKSELFILGANGFIGKEVVKEALGRGFQARRRPTSAKRWL